MPQRVTGATAERGRGVYAWGHDGEYGRKAGNSLPSLTVLRSTHVVDGDDNPKYIYIYIHVATSHVAKEYGNK